MWTAGARNCNQYQVEECAWDHTVYHGHVFEGVVEGGLIGLDSWDTLEEMTFLL